MLVYVLIAILLHISHLEAEDACSSGLCECYNEARNVNCSGLNLTYIPRLPFNSTSLSFDFNNIPNITLNTFVNISSSKIVNLKLRYCKITNIEKDSFRDLKHLRNLSLSGNPFSTESLYSIACSLANSHIDDLHLQDIGLTEIPSGLFNDVDTYQLRSLQLSYNKLELFNFTVLKPLKSLIRLDLSYNGLTHINLDKLSQLNTLELSSNSIVDLPKFCDMETVYFPRLRKLHLYNNSIRKYVPQNLNCQMMLSHLYLNFNCLYLLTSNSFSHLPALIHLSLPYQDNARFPFGIESHAFNNSKLQYLDLKGIRFSIQHINLKAFAGCSNLTYLSLSSNTLFDSDRLDEVLSPLMSLQKLNMSNTHLNSMPIVVGKFLHLNHLDVSSNKIESWPSGFWINNTKLHDFRVRLNLIKTLTKKMLPTRFRNQLTIIDFAFNPLVCDCDLVWFIEWIHRDKNKFMNFPRGYGCLNITESICFQNTSAFYAVTTVSCVLIFVIFIISMVYKYRWFIKYYIYIWKHQPRYLLNLEERNFVYDIFVSYCAEDSNWIVDQLLPNLEGENGNIKLCIHQRDFVPGRLIIDNIVESIEGSRRVLIVLSNNFAKSEWCQFEMTLAQKHVLDLCVDPLFVVLLEDIDCENMSKSMHALLKTTTYITWNDDLETFGVFWEKLKKSLQIY